MSSKKPTGPKKPDQHVPDEQHEQLKLGVQNHGVQNHGVQNHGVQNHGVQNHGLQKRSADSAGVEVGSARGRLSSVQTTASNLYRMPSRLTYAAVVDLCNEETEITELMIRRACDEMEKYQQFPFAPRR